MNIPIERIKQLRAETGAGVQDCRKSLERFDNDYGKALGYLREQGLEKAARLNDRPALQGMVEVYSHSGGRVGVLVEINAETDYAIRSPRVREFAHEVALQVAASAPRYVRDVDIPAADLEAEIRRAETRAREEGRPEEMIPTITEAALERFRDEMVLLRQPYIRDDNLTVAELHRHVVAAVRENVVIRRIARWEAGEEE